MDDTDTTVEPITVWIVFGDLMSGLLGAFVLILVGVVGVQLDWQLISKPKYEAAA